MFQAKVPLRMSTSKDSEPVTWIQDMNSLPLPPNKAQNYLLELPGPPGKWDMNLIAFLVEVWEWNGPNSREMGRGLLKNVFTHVAGKCSFFDVEAFGRRILVLIRLWENYSSSGWNFWSFGRDLSILHKFRGEHTTCRAFLIPPLSQADLN